jgi:mannose-6-phosphate isomerase-like protein (cupin superfamily)
MYDKSDPRAALAPVSKSMLGVAGLVAEPQTGFYYKDAPQVDDATGKTWMTRSHNFIVALTEAKPGAQFTRKGQPDEYAVLLPETGATIEWNGTRTEVPGNTLSFVPAGDSTVTLPQGGQLVRIFSVRSGDLAAACANATGYDTPRTHIPDFQPWPEPKDGWKVRTYDLDIAPEEGRFGRIFRCTTLMVNVLYPFDGPRDPSKMSPHHHDDFEQVSLALSGSFTHYLRWHWTPDMADWRPDEAVEMDSPSVLVIPPPVIHTTRATGEGSNVLVDIFGPPRVDFSLKPGWVLNADDYPMPQAADQEA